MSEPAPPTRASRVAWPRQEEKTHQSQSPSLVFSLATLVMGLVIAGLLFFSGHRAMALLVTIISSLVFFLSRFAPGIHAVIERFFQRCSRVVGLVITWIFLVPFFFIFFPTGRLFQKLRGVDPMQRAIRPDALSYWQDAANPVSDKSCRRQF